MPSRVPWSEICLGGGLQQETQPLYAPIKQVVQTCFETIALIVLNPACKLPGVQAYKVPSNLVH